MKFAQLLPILLVIVVDQAAKYLVVGNGNFQINTGIALNFFQDNNLLNFFLSLLVLIAIITYYLRFVVLKNRELLLTWSWGFIIGGGISNLFDRVIHQGVVDFIGLFNLPRFNFADIAITLGVLGIILVVFLKNNNDEKLHGQPR